MFLRLIVNLLFVLFVTSCFQTKHSQKFLNLNFEKSANGNAVGWITGEKGYLIFVDTLISYAGNNSLFIKKVAHGNFGVATSIFQVNDAKGKYLRYSGHIKTENITDGYAGLWWRVDGTSGTLNFDNMYNRGPNGTTDWGKYTIEFLVDENAVNINFGVILSGNGKAWFDNLQIELNGELYEDELPEVINISSKQLNWLKNNLYTFDTPDPSSSNKDLYFLEAIIGDARIVSLGEATHGTSEFFKMKHRITKYLAEEMGFTVFAIEANMPEAQKVNEYILTGKGDPKEALEGLYFWTWNTQEVLDLIEWMREYNASQKGRIEFFGFDMQFPNVAIENILNYIKKYDSDYYKKADDNYQKVISFNQELRKMKISPENIFIEPFLKYASEVYNHLLENFEVYKKVSDKNYIEWIIQNARIVIQGIEAKMQNKTSRDKSMALNINWILNQMPNDTKIVLWAHNGHVSKKETEYRQPMGSYLMKKYGKQMVVLGFAFHEGKYVAVGSNGLGIYTTSVSQPGSLEWMLHSTGIERLFFDLRKINNSPISFLAEKEIEFRSIGAKALDFAFYQTLITNEYDGIIYFDKTTPSACFNLTTK